MKKIIYTIVFILFVSFSFSQTIKPITSFYNDMPRTSTNQVYYKDIYNTYAPFIGTWHYQNGNQTFIVTIWKATKRPSENSSNPEYFMDYLFGHYKLVENYGTVNETVIYTSETTYLNTTTPIKTIINGDCLEINTMKGTIWDINTRSNNYMYYMGKRGFLTFTIDENNPNIAYWLVEKTYEENMTGTPTPSFVIPLNMILTKQ